MKPSIGQLRFQTRSFNVLVFTCFHTKYAYHILDLIKFDLTNEYTFKKSLTQHFSDAYLYQYFSPNFFLMGTQIRLQNVFSLMELDINYACIYDLC